MPNKSNASLNIGRSRQIRLSAALPILLQASDDSRDLAEEMWQFAPALWELLSAGLQVTDLRWGISLGILEHATEIRHGGEKRAFSAVTRLAIDDRSCFILSAAGIEFSRLVLAKIERHSENLGMNPSDFRPHWDAEKRKLTLGGRLVKHFRTPANCQELILAAFEEEGWPVRVDDPLPQVDNREPTERLHDAVRRLNGKQQEVRINFLRDGKGQGICWEV